MKTSAAAVAALTQEAQLGREHTKISIDIPSMPPISAKPAAKQRAFEHAFHAIDSHFHAYDLAELTTCICAIVPGSHALAKQQAAAAAGRLRHALTDIKHLRATNFLFHDEMPANPNLLQLPPDRRPALLHHIT